MNDARFLLKSSLNRTNEVLTIHIIDFVSFHHSPCSRLILRQRTHAVSRR